MTELQRERAGLCPCSCCADAINRNDHGRGFEDACDCEDFSIDEQCDCWFCEMGIS